MIKHAQAVINRITATYEIIIIAIITNSWRRAGDSGDPDSSYTLAKVADHMDLDDVVLLVDAIYLPMLGRDGQAPKQKG